MSSSIDAVEPLNMDTAVVPVTLCDVATLDSKAVESWETILEDFLAKDDVICPRFLQNLIVILRDDHLLSVPEKVIASLVEKWGVESIRTCTTSNDTDSTILDGPYFVQHSAIYHAWRIYEDPVGAFMCSIAPALSASNAGAGITFESLQISGIATPSRLYSEEKCERRPLSGMRFGIKDVIDVKGVVTTCGNRAYESLHGRAQESATCVERLLDAGAVIVGKTKTVQFASGETARDWIDYQASFNIRGDGYQEPGGSSAGSAAGVAAYTWLDGAIGTDS
ncbi:MAG: hypothetical protein M1828_001316 [Chrysothrix sp. TS-e1954]|nr:MAG: hypothetical protein M1828_001316 [Chrysothrix sp. TS-e1954]